jgi:MerC mercury resistance protein.
MGKNICNNVAVLYLCRMPKLKINWDTFGISASLACAVHCALLPLFLTSLPLFGINIIHNQGFEYGMILLSFCVGIVALYHGWRKHHHSIKPILIFSTGMAFLLAKQYWHRWEVLLLIPAVILIVSGHLLNFKSCRVHNHAHAEDCNH